jgi:large subunit ribosomal protein L17
MRHRVSGKQLSRNTAHRKALRRNMAASLFEHEAIRTTQAKARELRPFVERLITIARRNTLHARRQVIALMQDRAMVDEEGDLKDQSVVQKLFGEIAPRYAERPGGYTRIIRLAERRIGDGGRQVLMQLVEAAKPRTRQAGTSRRRRRGRKTAATGPSSPDAEQAPPADQQPAQDQPQQ